MEPPFPAPDGEPTAPVPPPVERQRPPLPAFRQRVTLYPHWSAPDEPQPITIEILALTEGDGAASMADVPALEEAGWSSHQVIGNWDVFMRVIH